MNATLKRPLKQLKSVASAIFFALVFAVAIVAPIRPAHAQLAVACVNCSDIITQLTQYAEQLTQYAKQVQQYELQVQQYQNMVKNTTTIPTMIFDNALNTVRGIENIMNGGSNVRYMMPNLDSGFTNLYPGVYSHISQIAGFNQQQSLNYDFTRSQQSYDASQTALKAAQQQSYDLTNDQYRMDSLGSYLVGANGNLDGLQAAGMYAQQTAQQLMKMRQIGLIQVQTQAVNTANQARKEDMKTAALQIWTADKPLPATPSPRTSDSF